ncbi:ribosome silencing factor [Denitratisoma sp. DHT3]|uniref:ribosome silencing factor n=1 Tax=Denitratisoma sp. DHT3 TaxID=1981880 RepID=UPI001198B437|nr:ribosome silencing factor [Denitratisoma sp. DHT3]QDX81571.1 ribosome silencing factor [Denitratisoma sp. DHT3]
MDIRKLQKIVVAALEDIKGEDIEVINTARLTSLFERIVIASGNSNRQVKALARNVHDKVKEAGGEVIGVEGEAGGEWVLVDLGDIVVHVMQPAVRSFYNLEELWQAGARRSGARRAAAGADEEAGDGDGEAPVPRAKPASVRRSRSGAAKSPDQA